MTQLSFYLRSDTWLAEYCCFDMLYGVRCVDDAVPSIAGSMDNPSVILPMPSSTERIQ